MDSSGNLRYVDPEELYTMEGLSHPVISTNDIPPEKRSLFEAVDGAGRRKSRKIRAKELGVSWQEYQIYRTVKAKANGTR